MTMAKTKNKRPGKPRGMNYADMLAHRKAINAVKLDAAALLLTEQAMQRALWLTVCSLSETVGIGQAAEDARERRRRLCIRKAAYPRGNGVRARHQILTRRSLNQMGPSERCSAGPMWRKGH